MFEPDENGVYVSLYPSAPRRWIGLGTLYALALVLLYLTMTAGLGIFGTVCMVAIVCAVLWLAERMRRVTSGWLELRTEGLFDQSGVLLAPLDDVAAVERGAFAFKPSNGFAIVLNTPIGFHWAPGLWWRVGRRVGVGGVISSSNAKFVADLLAQKSGAA